MPMKHQCFRLVAVFVLLVTQAPVAKAYIVPPPTGTVEALMDCFDSEKFNSDSRDAPAIIASSLRGEGARLAFRTCHDFDANTHYYVRAPRPKWNGVCRAFEEEIFPAAASDRVRVPVTYRSMGQYIVIRGWTRSIPQNWATLHYATRTWEYGFPTVGACPFGDDPRYASLANITDDVLKSFQSGWGRIAASQQSLETAIAKLPAVIVGIEHFDTPERQQQLRERAIKAVLEGRERPIGYRCDTGNTCFATFDSFTIGFVLASDGIVLTKLFANMRG